MDADDTLTRLSDMPDNIGISVARDTRARTCASSVRAGQLGGNIG